MRGRALNIVYDLDGVLNQINEFVFNSLGIANKLNLTYYNIFNNTHILSGDEMDKIIEMYNNPDAFRMARPVNGVHRILDILDKPDYNVNVYVHSLCYNQGVRKEKEKWLRKYVGIPKNRMILEVGGNKSVLETVDIIVEDCLANIINSKAMVAKVLIDKTYNRVEQYNIPSNTIIRDMNPSITRVINLDKAIDMVEEVVKYYHECNTGNIEYGSSITW